MLGAAYGIAVDAILIDAIVNTQKIQTLYSAAPHWSWWVAHGIFGITLGLLSTVLLEQRRSTSSITARRLTTATPFSVVTHTWSWK